MAGVCGARRTLFDQLDTDGSGGIDGDELAAAWLLRATRCAMSYQCVLRTTNSC